MTGAILTEPEVVVCIVRLVFGGVAAFLSLLLWSRTRDGAWTSLVAGVVVGYAGLVYDLLRRLGLDFAAGILFPGTEVPLLPLLFIAVPGFFVSLALVLLISRTR